MPWRGLSLGGSVVAIAVVGQGLLSLNLNGLTS